ncbi:MAG TPA: type II toxin-antitoxin system PrlF family antitoxin [Thermomicrobiales bacterium]|nr:type II toxin-antitoxin system PrlF family antitoxin [Thermomicrobiales bacterium]
MKEFVASLTSKGQITIPVEVRRHLGVSERDKLAFVIDDDGRVHVEPLEYPDVDSIVGIAGTLDRPLSWDEMIAIAYEDRNLAARKLQ